jgi:hypothetical protein
MEKRQTFASEAWSREGLRAPPTGEGWLYLAVLETSAGGGWSSGWALDRTIHRSLALHHRRWRTREQASADPFEYIEGFYNRRRRHVEYEEAMRAA